MGAFLFSGTGTENFFEKVWESRKKIRQRESEKAMSLPGTLKISYTFIRYIPARGRKPQPDEGAPRTSCLQGLLRNVDKRENEIVGGEPDEGDKPPEKKPRDLER